MKKLLASSLLILIVCVAAFGGQNENASISIDLNYVDTGNQGVTVIDAPGIGAFIYFEVRVDNVVQFDAFGFELLYQREDLTFVTAYEDNIKGDEEEQNILLRAGGSLTSAGTVVDSSSTLARVRFSRACTNDDPAKAPSGEGLIALMKFKAKVDAPRGVTFDLVDFYDVYEIKDSIKDENKGSAEFGGGSLPVELSAFTARVVDDTAVLEWTTESEKDSWGFFILRSTSKDKDFRRVNAEIIKGAGTKTTRTFYSYTDRYELEMGATYFYQLEQVDVNGARTLYGPIELTLSSNAGEIPDQFVLQNNYPNPFNPETTIKFEIPKDEFITLEIYNIAGTKIRTLVNSSYKAGEHSATWDGRNDNGDKVSSGAYLYKFRAGAFIKNGKMMLLN